MTSGGTIVTKSQKEVSRTSLGLVLSLVIILSFNAGMFIAPGLRHGSANHDHLLFLLFLGTGCFSLLAAAFLAFVLIKKIGNVQSGRSSKD
jgi:hypothetical protein